MDIKKKSEMVSTHKNSERASKRDTIKEQFLLPEDEVPLEEIKRDQQIEKQGRGDADPEDFSIKE